MLAYLSRLGRFLVSRVLFVLVLLVLIFAGVIMLPMAGWAALEYTCARKGDMRNPLDWLSAAALICIPLTPILVYMGVRWWAAPSLFLVLLLVLGVSFSATLASTHALNESVKVTN